MRNIASITSICVRVACGKMNGDVTRSFSGERWSEGRTECAARPSCSPVSSVCRSRSVWPERSRPSRYLSIVICPMDAPPLLRSDLDLPGPISLPLSLFTSTTCISALVVEGAFNGVELWTAVLSISARSGRSRRGIQKLKI